MVEDAQKDQNRQGWDNEIEVRGALDELIDESAVPTRNRSQNGLDEDRCECACNPKRESHWSPPQQGHKEIPPLVISAGELQHGSVYDGPRVRLVALGEPLERDADWV